MKEVTAVIRQNMMNKTKKALSEAGISSMTALMAQGRGKGLVDYKLIHGAEENFEEAIALLGQRDHLVPKRLLMIAVPDDLVQRVVDTVLKVNQSGKHGDGKIFVSPMLEAFRIRSSELNEPLLDEA